MHQRALHPRRDRPGLLVDRHDAAGVDRRIVFIRIAADDFVFRIGELQSTAAAELDRAVEHDQLAGLEDVAQERLIRKHRAHRTGLVLDDQFEQPEAGPARRPNPARQDFAGDRRRGAGSQARDRQERRSIFVPQRKTQQQIFDGEQAHALEVGGPAGADAFDELQRRGQPVCARRGHCTITARPRWSSTC